MLTVVVIFERGKAFHTCIEKKYTMFIVVANFNDT